MPFAKPCAGWWTSKRSLRRLFEALTLAGVAVLMAAPAAEETPAPQTDYGGAERGPAVDPPAPLPIPPGQWPGPGALWERLPAPHRELALELLVLGFHAGEWACQLTALLYGIEPVGVDDLPADVAAELRGVFPARLIEGARLYFDMPLTRPASPVGLLNWLSGFGHGGGSVIGMAFRDNVYLCFPMDDLLNGPPAREILAHELTHVSQYRLFGFEAYARDYLEELLTGVPYAEVTFEADAYLLDELYPHAPPGFFSIPGPDTMADTDGQWVNITAWAESFERWGQLVHCDNSLRLRDVDGNQLAVFERATPDAKLLFNEPGYGNGGNWIVAVASGAGVEILWRDEETIHKQWFPGSATYGREGGEDGGGPLWLKAQPPRGPGREFRWIGSGFLAF